MLHIMNHAKEILYVFKDRNGNKKIVAVKGVYVTNVSKGENNISLNPAYQNNPNGNG